jgi:diguanylate cyclase (GGDEF)-like protein
VLSSEWRRAQRAATSISLLMIDADSFKAYNDAHGHQAGDAALVSIAQCIGDGTRRGPTSAFATAARSSRCCCRAETIQGAFGIAEEIRASVLSLRVQQQGRPDLCPTISIGVAAMVPQAGLAPGDLIKSADLALYEAKRSDATGRSPLPPWCARVASRPERRSRAARCLTRRQPGAPSARRPAG